MTREERINALDFEPKVAEAIRRFIALTGFDVSIFKDDEGKCRLEWVEEISETDPGSAINYDLCIYLT